MTSSGKVLVAGAGGFKEKLTAGAGAEKVPAGNQPADKLAEQLA